MKIGIVISSLGCGGAERCARDLAVFFSRTDHQVVVFTLANEKPFFALPPEVVWQPLGEFRNSTSIFQGLKNNWSRIAKLISGFKRYGIQRVVSFMEEMNVISLLAGRFCGVPVIISEHSVPQHNSRGGVWSLLTRLTYPKARRGVVLTTEVADYFRRRYDIPITVLPNTVTLRDCWSPRPWGDPLRVVVVGRLSHEKGHDLLLPAFKVVHEQFPSITLTCFGAGPEHDRLLQQRDALGLSDVVLFPGIVSSLAETLAQYDVLVCPSRYEGFGNVLIEAMAEGVPVVAFACRYGPQKILSEGVNGLLVAPEDVSGLARALIRLLGDEPLRDKLRSGGRKRAEDFQDTKIYAEWARLIA